MEYLGVLMGLTVGYFGNHLWQCYQGDKCFAKRHRKQSQIMVIKEHLEAGKSITNEIAFKKYKIKALSTYIHELRSMGMDITTEKAKDGRIGIYTLNK